MKLWTLPLIGLLPIASIAILGQTQAPLPLIQSQTEATVFVVGAVRMPGAYPLIDAANLLNALKASGGLQPDANSRAVVIVRPANVDTPNSKDEKFTVNLREVLSGRSPDFQLKAHDVVYIPKISNRGPLQLVQ
jgi:protein involved in polysaccharide export with SLBB domain